jgi:hypothetical protein
MMSAMQSTNFGPSTMTITIAVRLLVSIIIAFCDLGRLEL